jgi:hypothetical protein
MWRFSGLVRGIPFPDSVDRCSADAVAQASFGSLDSGEKIGNNGIAFGVAEMPASHASIFGYACVADPETSCQNHNRLNATANFRDDLRGQLALHVSGSCDCNSSIIKVGSVSMWSPFSIPVRVFTRS